MSIRLALVTAVLLIPLDGSCKLGSHDETTPIAVKTSRTSLEMPQPVGKSRV